MESSTDYTIVGVHPKPWEPEARIVLHYRDQSVELPVLREATAQHVAIQTALNDLKMQAASRDLELALKREREAEEDVRLRREALALVASRLSPIVPPSGRRDVAGESVEPGA